MQVGTGTYLGCFRHPLGRLNPFLRAVLHRRGYPNIEPVQRGTAVHLQTTGMRAQAQLVSHWLFAEGGCDLAKCSIAPDLPCTRS